MAEYILSQNTLLQDIFRHSYDTNVRRNVPIDTNFMVEKIPIVYVKRVPLNPITDEFRTVVEMITQGLFARIDNVLYMYSDALDLWVKMTDPDAAHAMAKALDLNAPVNYKVAVAPYMTLVLTRVTKSVKSAGTVCLAGVRMKYEIVIDEVWGVTIVFTAMGTGFWYPRWTPAWCWSRSRRRLPHGKSSSWAPPE